MLTKLLAEKITADPCGRSNHCVMNEPLRPGNSLRRSNTSVDLWVSWASQPLRLSRQPRTSIIAQGTPTLLTLPPDASQQNMMMKPHNWQSHSIHWLPTSKAPAPSGPRAIDDQWHCHRHHPRLRQSPSSIHLPQPNPLVVIPLPRQTSIV
jgi:hypothetical protein